MKKCYKKRSYNTLINCLICGKKFKGKHGNSKYCGSKECYLERERRRSKERLKDPKYKKRKIELVRMWVIKNRKRANYNMYRWLRIKKGTWKTPCKICNELRNTERCHIIPTSEDGTEKKENILFLCPTHHKILDNWLMKGLGNQFTKEEYSKIKEKIEIIVSPRKI